MADFSLLDIFGEEVFGEDFLAEEKEQKAPKKEQKKAPKKEQKKAPKKAPKAETYKLPVKVAVPYVGVEQVSVEGKEEATASEILLELAKKFAVNTANYKLTSSSEEEEVLVAAISDYMATAKGFVKGEEITLGDVTIPIDGEMPEKGWDIDALNEVLHRFDENLIGKAKFMSVGNKLVPVFLGEEFTELTLPVVQVVTPGLGEGFILRAGEDGKIVADTLMAAIKEHDMASLSLKPIVVGEEKKLIMLVPPTAKLGGGATPKPPKEEKFDISSGNVQLLYNDVAYPLVAAEGEPTELTAEQVIAKLRSIWGPTVNPHVRPETCKVEFVKDSKDLIWVRYTNGSTKGGC